MRIDTLLITLFNAIASDSTLKTWATTQYGHIHKVFVNIDQNNPPKESDCPFVVIAKSSKSEGQGIDPKVHGFLVRCAINDDSTTTPSHSNITLYTGVANLETFRRYTRNAITGASFGNLTVESILTEYGPLESFPWFDCEMSININEDFVLGGEAFE